MRITHQEKIYKALAHEARLHMVKYLKGMKYATVTKISETVNVSVKTTSKHLQILHQAGVLDTERHGVAVYYFIKKPLSPLIRSIISFL